MKKVYHQLSLTSTASRERPRNFRKKGDVKLFGKIYANHLDKK